MNQNEPKGKQREPKRTKVRLHQQGDSDDLSMSGHGCRDQQQAGYFLVGFTGEVRELAAQGLYFVCYLCWIPSVVFCWM